MSHMKENNSFFEEISLMQKIKIVKSDIFDKFSIFNFVRRKLLRLGEFYRLVCQDICLAVS